MELLVDLFGYLSIIDLPQPGCWRLSLTWPGKTDTIDLVYVQGNAS